MKVLDVGLVDTHDRANPDRGEFTSVDQTMDCPLR